MKTPIKAIREKCLDCSSGSFTEAENCPVTNCALYPYRFGMRPDTAAAKGKITRSSSENQDYQTFT